MAESDDLAEALRLKALHKTDQRDAEAAHNTVLKAREHFVYENAKAEYERFCRLLADRVKRVNSTHDPLARYVLETTPVPVLSLGVQQAVIIYHQEGANFGRISLSIHISRRPSNYEMFGLPEANPVALDEPIGRDLLPTYDVATNSIAWTPNGSAWTSEKLADWLMGTLMDRQ